MTEHGEFEVGDVVELLTGGPAMTVRAIRTDLWAATVECRWVASKNRTITRTFRVSELLYLGKEDHQ